MKIRCLLNESVDQNALKAFLNSLKSYRYTNDIIDTESLITAIKSEVPGNIWNDLFNDYVQLKHRGTYGTIKNSSLVPEIKKALVEYWLFQFKTYSFSKSTMYTKYLTAGYYDFRTSTGDKLNAELVAKREAEQKAKEEAEQKAWEATTSPLKEIAEKTISSINKQLYDETVLVWNEEFPEEKSTLTTPVVDVNKKYKVVQILYFRDYGITVDKSDDPIKLAARIDSYMESRKKKALEHKEEREAKEHSQNKHSNAKWWSPELEQWINEKREGRFVFQWPDDEGVQVIKKLDWLTIKRCGFSDDVILAGVVTSYSPEMRNRYSATESSYHYIYYSVSNSADEMAIDELGVLLDPSKFVDTSSWGEEHYRELSKADVDRSKDYFKSGMDRWFYYSSESYGSD